MTTTELDLCIERDVSEPAAGVWVDYWTRLGWEIVGLPEVIGLSAHGQRILTYRLHATRSGLAEPPEHAIYDRHAPWAAPAAAC